ncbi:TetR/AcrR family transcriptional regulator [Amycolatopsis lurida]|uniref:TetR/AcrR family transcriptional regulator n=1 Tax=Amycolatopsis lurida TaxID=31959 RepID=UPI003656C9D4
MKRKLAREDWADAALEALCDGGVAAIAVEPLAAKLGTTKGSFYWHFANRDALVEAAVRRWVEHDTEALITLLDGISDPERRLRELFELVFSGKDDERAELTLLAHAGDPVIGPLLADVTARRVDFIVRCFREMGRPETEARHRGLRCARPGRPGPGSAGERWNAAVRGRAAGLPGVPARDYHRVRRIFGSSGG